MRIGRTAGAALAAAFLATAAMAASEEEWRAFRAEVASACVAAAAPLFASASATVDPFGSESYGLALLRGSARGSGADIAAICVYDKKSKAAEIGTEIDLAAASPGGDAARVAWREVIGACAGACRSVLDRLAPVDAAALMALPDRVARTVAAIEAAPGLSWDEPSRAVLAEVAGADPTRGLADVGSGKHPCTVYWYGFLEEAGSRVGRHQCRVERDGDRMTVSKLTGDGFFAVLEPIGPGARIAVGRTYLPDQSERRYDGAAPANAGNGNFGNRVGIAFAVGSRLMIVGADMRGFTEPDDTYFDVLVVE